MRHVTVSVQEETFREIRAWCAQRDTCISHVVQAFLNDLPRLEDVPCFPLSCAPHPQSLGAHFDRFQRAEIEAIQLRLAEFG